VKTVCGRQAPLFAPAPTWGIMAAAREGAT
jgi:hypothetical protein